jgi:hypothetical protein
MGLGLLKPDRRPVAPEVVETAALILPGKNFLLIGASHRHIG